MGRMRTCALCGASIKQNVAAHDCPHGLPCRYAVDDNNMPTDWSTPACETCRSDVAPLRAVPTLALTDKALDVLE